LAEYLPTVGALPKTTLFGNVIQTRIDVLKGTAGNAGQCI
jgi:hypothetical protein